MNSAITIVAALLVGSAPAVSQLAGHNMSGMDMSGTQHESMAAPAGLHQVGEAAFAAIAEATAALEADPATDWSKVNIDALREHLVDMDNVTVHSDVARTDIPGGARFAITSADARVRDSINRMVRLHSSMANKEGHYHLVPAAIADGTALTVTGTTPADVTKIRGLGLFGLLTEGVHHELHHMMLAEGEPMNH